ncbi:MAG: SpaH/EbpB family LPXTG-anchored major pilin, partial [Oscillospiraceae bacterium]|nr:SpaH/EbpB family LPXTG-anchored major pilin [Oscillospiraceae bacterium]
MKHIKKIFAIALAAVMLLSCVPSAFAATAETSVVDYDADCSLTIYAFNWTDAYKDGVVDENTFTSSGWQDTVVEDTFINATPVGGSPEQVLGNSQTSNGYAVKGAEFTILNLATPLRYNEVVDEVDAPYFLNYQIFMFEKPKAADFLKAIGLADGAGQCEMPADIDTIKEQYYLYTSDTIIDALAQALENNATEVKDALEAYINNNGGIKMDLTDEDGRTSTDELNVGLYLVVETAVPETVTATTNPFLISLPMTTVNNNTEGTAPEGGHEWNYDVTVYPKNTSGIPTLEKTVREAASDTGTNNGSDTITDGFAHTATGSAGDTMEYQIISSLPTITSQATALSCFNFYDNIAPGLSYNKDVRIEFFTDKNCTDKVATWTQDDGRFTVSYSEDGQSMTIDVTAAGLAEINGDTE